MLFTLALQLQMREVSAWASTSFFLLDSSLVTVTSCCCCSSSSIGCQSVEKAAFGVWPSLFAQDRPSRGEIKARSRDAHQATVESDLLIKKKTHQLKLLTYANSVVTLLQVVNSLYTFGPILNTQFNSWCGKWEQRVHAYMKTLGKNAQRIKRTAER